MSCCGADSGYHVDPAEIGRWFHIRICAGMGDRQRSERTGRRTRRRAAGHQHVFHDPSPTRNRFSRADQYGWSRFLEVGDGPDENPHRGAGRPNEVPRPKRRGQPGIPRRRTLSQPQRRYLANANAGADARACIPYQTRQAFTWTIGWPARQPKAWANSGILPSTLFTRYRARECPCVMTAVRATSGRTSPHHTLA
jgi:hypothetical protein